jgi:hypothetical protein
MAKDSSIPPRCSWFQLRCAYLKTVSILPARERIGTLSCCRVHWFRVHRSLIYLVCGFQNVHSVGGIASDSQPSYWAIHLKRPHVRHHVRIPKSSVFNPATALSPLGGLGGDASGSHSAADGLTDPFLRVVVRVCHLDALVRRIISFFSLVGPGQSFKR